MTSTFFGCTTLMSLLQSSPSKGEMEALLRITPQGMAKVNSDLIRGKTAEDTLIELSSAYNAVKDLHRKLECKTVTKIRNIEEVLALQWAKGMKMLDTVSELEISESYITDLVWDFRVRSLIESREILRIDDEYTISSTTLVNTSFKPVVDYINVMEKSESKMHVFINPLYWWFDQTIKLEPIHFQMCEKLSAQQPFIVPFRPSRKKCNRVHFEDHYTQIQMNIVSEEFCEEEKLKTSNAIIDKFSSPIKKRPKERNGDEKTKFNRLTKFWGRVIDSFSNRNNVVTIMS
eukprot:NODE_1150_length_2099_cov_42.442814_g970_i0.p1 GENE.NODE_1150_length_2099_cov_42.442814_g970_i0~~NODE_1150_length_2099_cov_42.442814_g970_i0.p1  ORF type:complete len:289 (+),score=38.22 NODE_1150_length_2099_cov_42.442814_g970_i0:62-928(+)